MSYQRIQLRRDTAAKWAATNPVLASGEPGYEIDTGRYKIGNGASKWTALPYAVERGPAGPAGASGQAGPQGDRGARGERGAQGPAGPAGPATVLSIGSVTSGALPSATLTGSAPSQTLNLVLPRGEKGERGERGERGPDGPQGPQGDAAGVVVRGKATQWPPAASPDTGDIYVLPNPVPLGTPPGFSPGDAALWDDEWINVGPLQGPKGDKGDKGDPGIPGKDGANGLPGAIGPAGPANVLTIGTVSVAAPGTQPGVWITGGSPAQTLSFALPAPTASALRIGTVTSGHSASAEIVGDPPNQVLNLVLPNPAINHSTVFHTNPLDVTATVGGTVRFSADAYSTEWPIVWSWQTSTDGANWTDIDGSGYAVLEFPVTADTKDGLYRCSAATPSVGRVYSTIAKLTVRSAVEGNLVWKLAEPPTQHHLLGPRPLGIPGDALPRYDLRECRGFLYTQQYRSSDGINWQRLRGIPDGYTYHNQIMYFNGVYMMWCSVGGAEPDRLPAVAQTRYLSSNGLDWEPAAGLWAAGEVPAVFYNNAAAKEELEFTGNKLEGTWSSQDGRTRDLATVVTYPLRTFHEVNSNVSASTLRSNTLAYTSRIGDSAGVSDHFVCFTRGRLPGQTEDHFFAFGLNGIYYAPYGAAAGSALTRLSRPVGIDFRHVAYGNGIWVATHRLDRHILYKSSDLQNWTAEFLNDPDTQFGYYHSNIYTSLGAPAFVGGRFVIPLLVNDSVVVGFAHTDPL